MTPDDKADWRVPSDYLRAFCADDGGINVYERGGDFYPRVPPEEHARDRPLGALLGPLEDMLRVPGGDWLEVTGGILDRLDTPPAKSSTHNRLLSLVLELASRTKFATPGANDIISATVAWLVEQLPGEFDIPWPGPDHPPDGRAWAIARAYALVPQLLDLQALLIRNKHRQTPFIASDNPVLFYNQLLESGGVPFSSTAPAARGLQIFVPLSPEACLLFYDGTSYDTARSGSKARVRAKRTDVDRLNALQYKNSHLRLFAPTSAEEDYVRHIVSEGSGGPRAEEIPVNEFADLTERSKQDSPLLLFGREDTRCELDLSFISSDEDALPEDPATRPLDVRDRRWHHVCRMYRGQIPVLADRGADHLGFRHWFDDIRGDEDKHELANQYLELIDGHMYTPEQWPEWLAQVEQHEDFTWELP